MAGKRGNGENSIYLSGGRWHVQGFLNGRRRRVSRTRRADAVAAWAELVRTTPATPLLAVDGPVRTADPRTVGQALDLWFELTRDRWRHSTTVGYRCAIDRHLTPHLGDLPVARLSVQHVERWQHQLLADGLAPSTVRQARIILGQAIAMLVRYGQLAANPVTAAAGLPRTSRDPDHLTAAEAARAIAAATGPHRQGPLAPRPHPGPAQR